MNMGVNGNIITAVLVIGSAGILNTYNAKPDPIVSGITQNTQPKKDHSVYRVLLGAGILLICLSLLDTFGGPASEIASALSMLAMVYCLIEIFPWSMLSNALGKV